MLENYYSIRFASFIVGVLDYRPRGFYNYGTRPVATNGRKAVDRVGQGAASKNCHTERRDKRHLDGWLVNLQHLAVIFHPGHLQRFNMMTSAVVVDEFPTSFGHTGLKTWRRQWCRKLQKSDHGDSRSPSGQETAASIHPDSAASSPPPYCGSFPTVHRNPTGVVKKKTTLSIADLILHDVT